METLNIISAILIYLVLPVIVIFGVMVLIRRKRQKEAGQTSSVKDKPLRKDDLHDVKADEGREARHTKPAPKNVDPETGEQPDMEQPGTKPTGRK